MLIQQLQITVFFAVARRAPCSTSEWKCFKYLISALSSNAAHLLSRRLSCFKIFSLSAGSADSAIFSPSRLINSTVGLRSSNNLWRSWKQNNQKLNCQEMMALWQDEEADYPRSGLPANGKDLSKLFSEMAGNRQTSIYASHCINSLFIYLALMD